MDTLSNLASGFQIALSLETLFFCFVGVALGTLVGVLPGLGSLAALSILLPITYYMDSTSALVMLAGLYYGVQYGSSTASILLNLPGTAASAVTCIDGYAMTRNGRGGIALFITAVASFVGGMFSIFLLIAFAPSLASTALKFGPSEYFSVMFLGLIAASTLSEGSAVKGFVGVVVGLLLGVVGADIETGTQRFVFGVTALFDGINMVALAMGIFAVSEILANFAGERPTVQARDISWRSMIPTRKDVRDSVAPTARGSVVGAIFGILPGAGGTIASFVAYGVERRVARDRSRFGKGAIEGVASPEAANNSAVQAAFIPTLSLGIPGDATMAIILAALMIQGIIPGPQLVTNHPDLFWGLVASFFIGNLMLLVLNIPMIGIWVRILAIPYHVLYPCILFFVCIGVFSISNSSFDVMLVAAFGALGYFMAMYGFPPAPVLLGFVLGPLMEENLRRALLIADGNFFVFVQRPISATLLACALALIVFTAVSAWRRGRGEITMALDPIDPKSS